MAGKWTKTPSLFNHQESPVTVSLYTSIAVYILFLKMKD
jgi:hypothetical protein